jgi:hypothetical protein
MAFTAAHGWFVSMGCSGILLESDQLAITQLSPSCMCIHVSQTMVIAGRAASTPTAYTPQKGALWLGGKRARSISDLSSAERTTAVTSCATALLRSSYDDNESQVKAEFQTTLQRKQAIIGIQTRVIRIDRVIYNSETLRRRDTSPKSDAPTQ